MKRTKHSLSHYKLATLDMGELIPVATYEALPGDTFDGQTAALIRLSPLVAPVMHPVTVRLHHWFVPHRLVWDGWEDFITGGNDGEGGDSGPFPTIDTGGSGAVYGELLDYMGVPPGVANIDVSALPVRSYNMVFNEFYRDQDLVSEVAEDSVVVQRIAWEKDYFTAARAWPQRGPEVTLPLGTIAPVITQSTEHHTGAEAAMRIRLATGAAPAANVALGAGAGTASATTTATVGGTGIYPTNLVADLADATAVNVNEVRRAFALQRYQEARAMYGARYVEYLRYLGIRPSDARLQRPVYLGGGKQTISFSEVLATAGYNDGVNDIPLGTMGGHGIAAMRSGRFRYFCEEHGTILTLMSVRPRSMYADGLSRMWTRRLKEDYYQRELERIGQQEVLKQELYVQGAAADTETWGYQDRYAEYRHLPSQVSADFRTTLNFWHLARLFGSLPGLNESFIECDPGKRIFAEQTADGLWCMINHRIRARRMVGRAGVGRIL